LTFQNVYQEHDVDTLRTHTRAYNDTDITCFAVSEMVERERTGDDEESTTKCFLLIFGSETGMNHRSPYQ